MANLIVSSVCTLRCPYCFAEEHLQATQADSAPVFISLETFEERLDFLDRSGIDEIRLIGGEPTLHPQFPELIRRAQLRGKRLLVFSHGLMSARALACLEALPPGQCTVLINMNATHNIEGSDQKETARRRVVLQHLNSRVLPGFNIYRTDFQLDSLLTMIVETGCRKALRLGLAQPILSGQNAYLHPKQYPIVGWRIVEYAQKAAEMGIRLEFDCGFVRCMFSDDDLEILHQCGTDMDWRCNPILDLDISGQVIHCFPLTGKIETPLTETSDAASLRAMLAEQAQPYRISGIYKECSTCPFKARGECTGGCLGATMRRFHSASLHVTVPDTAVVSSSNTA